MNLSSEQLAHYINSAHAANQRNEYVSAAKLSRRVVDAAPQIPEAWYNLGIALRGLGKKSQAINAFRNANSLTRDSAVAQNDIGLELLELDALADAETCFRRALQLEPDYVFAHSNLGRVLERKRDYPEAEALFQQAIDLQPNLAPLYINLSGIFNAQKKHASAESACRKAITLDPNSSDAWNNLGVALAGQHLLKNAEDAYIKAIALNPDSPDVYCNYANILKKSRRYEEVIENFRKALRLNPAQDFVTGELLSACMKICDWQNAQTQIAQIKAKIKRGEKVVEPFTVLAITDSLSLQLKAAGIFVKQVTEATQPLAISKSTGKDRIRIGYYSADYRNHAVANLIAGLFEQHDREKFEIIGFSFGPDTGDEMRKREANACDQFIDVRDQSDKAVAELSRDMAIDIAVDLNGYTETSRTGIFAHRAAPIQVNYLGYPGTMGAEFIDYVIADNILIPKESRKYYTEKVVYLPNSYQVNDSKRKIAEREFTRQELDLPDGGFVFCCFNNNYKITPHVFDVWMRLLQQVDDSVLWLLEDNAVASGNLRKEAAKRGVAADRLVFASRMPLDEHLARHRAADLFLDTLPYNAHTTASDALWAGLPVLTCTGQSFASRVCASLLSAIDLPELITSSHKEYELLACELATNPERLNKIRQKLAQNRLTQPLFDTALFARHIEKAYEMMYARYQQGLQPDYLMVLQ